MDLPTMLALLMLLLLASALMVGWTQSKHAWADAGGPDQHGRFDDKVRRVRDYAEALEAKAASGELDRAQIEPMVRQHIAEQAEFKELERERVLRAAMAPRREG